MATGDKTIIASKDYVNTELANKADKATTLSGYGITDAYTQAEVDVKVNEIKSELNPIAMAIVFGS